MSEGEKNIRILVENYYQQQVKSVQFSPHGDMIVSADSDGTVCVWRVETGKSLRKFKEHSGPVNSAQFSPDGTKIVSAGSDGTVQVCVTKPSLSQLCCGGYMETLGEHKGPVKSVQFSPDGEMVLSASEDGTLHLWDMPDSLRRRAIELKPTSDTRGCKCPINSAQFSPDGTKIVSAGENGKVCMWNTKNLGENPEIVLKEHNGRVNSAQFSPDGTKIVSASDDQTVWLCDVNTREGKTLVENKGWVISAQFNPDGDKIVYTTQNEVTTTLQSGYVKTVKRFGFVCVYDMKTNTVEETLKWEDAWPCTAQFSPNGDKIVFNTIKQEGSRSYIVVWEWKQAVVEQKGGRSSRRKSSRRKSSRRKSSRRKSSRRKSSRRKFSKKHTKRK